MQAFPAGREAPGVSEGKSFKEKMYELGTSFAHEPSAQRITRALLEQLEQIASRCDATAVFVYLDALPAGVELPPSICERLFYVTRKDGVPSSCGEDRLVRVPDVPLTRMGQVKIAIFMALSQGVIQRGDIVVFLAGVAASGTLDTLIVTEVGREFEMLSTVQYSDVLPPGVGPEVLERVLDIASELGSEGREGKPVGALFVIGDTEKVKALSRQLILNPFKGYPEEERNILSAELEETVKELAAVDGAFLVRGDGVIEACGVYLKVADTRECELPPGLGTRHHAAAAVTAVTESIAVTVSESTGTVSVFRGGRIIVEIEKPRSAVSLRREEGRL